ncbi:DUF5686 and carboxypeptidase regulatory-like domain-containing protein [Dysgonomonas sp. 25]|uniref:DUF5686 and carboxypeptidase regulatory-like domain-containing protein n=1 Tax=Dysgonomonas sp. 25 TaxID=2302933 RepID=UPI0013D8CBE7|nr:DUF5686 and carboxypeptidase regulatory-like domain-containing protein [Dysgonomonas sp. 25]NDV69717.1 carboxypeptidase-like regulatory domain-containing protein [Dysgonomonas sp. 25]
MKILRIRLILILLSFTFIHTLSAQKLTGKVVDAKNEAVPGATIYIKETNQGLLCNEDGLYQATLKAGSYTFEARCIGYKPATKSVTVPQGGSTVLDFVLEEKPFELAQVEVSAQEDPAYPIMRKAIEKAPYYAAAVESYSADAYIKGNAILTGMSKFMEFMSSKSDDGVKMADFKNQTFVQESYNEIQFTAPDMYQQKVNAFTSSFPDNLDAKDVMGVMGGSIYNERFNGQASPLCKGTFSYYRFRYEGYTEEDGMTINKIQVIAKVKDPQLFNGYLYIADDTWHVTYAELSGDIYGIKPNYHITYMMLGDAAYLPVTYQVNYKVDFMGIHGLLDYYASLTYKDVKVKENPLAALQSEGKKKRELELKNYSDRYKIESDSLAKKRDSLYWEQVRVVPLEIDEITSLNRRDSIQQRVDSIRDKHQSHKFEWDDLLTGGQVGHDSSTVTFKYGGLFHALRDFNFVDGLWVGQKFEVNIKRDSVNNIRIEPYLYYTTSRKKLMGGGKFQYDYAPMRQGRFEIEGGSLSEDFNPDGIPRLNNALRSLMRGKNENFFYQKDFIAFRNQIDLVNGLVLRTEFDIARREGLENQTDYTWGKRRYIKQNPFSGERFDRTSYMVSLNYAPFAYYSKWKGKKYYRKITSPIFMVGYREAIGTSQRDNSRFRLLMGGVKQEIPIGFFRRFDYLVEGGAFLGDKSRIHFTDFKHFNTANLMFTFKSPYQSFMLLDNYEASTNDWWLRTAFNYNDHYLLLKRLPFLQGKMFTESLHVKNLYTPDFKLYTEIGYSVDFVRSMNLGIFASFKKGHYESVGLRFTMKLDK